ncbi:unnamed protein product, partial [Meganyctiphanes norvegica]
MPNTRVLMVTANIASCFEQPATMLQPWISEFLTLVDEQQPEFIALHCQEVGGKNYEESMVHVEHFMKSLLVLRGSMMPYDRYRVFLDEEYTTADKFTALGNLYFIHNSVEEIQIWDFVDKKFVPCNGRQEHAGDIENVPIKEKAKFPQEFSQSECKWSRKGFMRTRWCLNGTNFDLVNIHLFHDASNLLAMDEFPSVYTKNRKRALEHTLDRFHNDGLDKFPFFMFGDFNFRLDTRGVVEKLCVNSAHEQANVQNVNTFCKAVQLIQGGGLLVVDLVKQCFLMKKKNGYQKNHYQTYFKEIGSLHEFDKERGQFGERLLEFDINFPPSYPFEEGDQGAPIGNQYMKTRCPSWCDRILMNKQAKDLVEKSGTDVKYQLLGLDARMGDHKPVCLVASLPRGSGTSECCSPHEPCRNFVHVPGASPCYTPPEAPWCLCQSYPTCPRPPHTPTTPTTILPLPLLCSSVLRSDDELLLTQSSDVDNDGACNVDNNSQDNKDVMLMPDAVGVSDSKLFCAGPKGDVDQCVAYSVAASSNGTTDDRLIQHTCCITSPMLLPTGASVPTMLHSKDLLRNLFHGKQGPGSHCAAQDTMLKRVNSAPVGQLEKHRVGVAAAISLAKSGHAPLLSSRSLDLQELPRAKLRLRASSSRHISHHSSSSEEWFEEVPPQQPEERGEPPPDQGGGGERPSEDTNKEEKAVSDADQMVLQRREGSGNSVDARVSLGSGDPCTVSVGSHDPSGVSIGSREPCGISVGSVDHRSGVSVEGVCSISSREPCAGSVGSREPCGVSISSKEPCGRSVDSRDPCGVSVSSYDRSGVSVEGRCCERDSENGGEVCSVASIKARCSPSGNQQQPSLNNLLLGESCDGLANISQTRSVHQSESSSISASRYSEDSVSSTGGLVVPHKRGGNNGGETVSQAPTTDIADVDSMVGSIKISQKKLCKKEKKDYSSRGPTAQCCCVLS